jgi:CheY-like chemotaxis protein
MLHKLIGENIDLTWKPAANILPVKMDPTQIDQILINLAVNARDSISGNGKIYIETCDAEIDDSCCATHTYFVPGHYVLLIVSDNGCGMDKETLDKVFDPFFTTKKLGKGTGMGLATVYGIVKQNNGFINVYSESGKGTTFRIYLPLHGDKDAALDKSGMHAEPLGGSETILLVEDEKVLLKLGKVMLEELGYNVLTASAPGEAIRIVEEHIGEIQLVVIDVVMPEMSGRDLQLRLSGLCPDLRFLFMSGYTANVIAQRGILDKGVNMLQKPFSMDDLASKVREALGKGL